MQSDFGPVPQLQVRHGLAADQGRRAHMEDATTAILDFRDNLNVEVAAQAPDISSFYGVHSKLQLSLHGNTLKAAQSASVLLSHMQVFDGHSGPDAANYAKDNLHTFFAGYLDADSLLPADLHEAMVSRSSALFMHCFMQ